MLDRARRIQGLLRGIEMEQQPGDKNTVFVITLPKGTDRRSWLRGYQSARNLQAPMGNKPYIAAFATPCCKKDIIWDCESFPLADACCSCGALIFLVRWQES